MKQLDLKKFRKERELTQNDLAKILGVGQSFISQAENGHDGVPDDWLPVLEKHFGEIDWNSYKMPEKSIADINTALLDANMVIDLLQKELSAKNLMIDKLLDALTNK